MSFHAHFLKIFWASWSSTFLTILFNFKQLQIRYFLIFHDLNLKTFEKSTKRSVSHIYWTNNHDLVERFFIDWTDEILARFGRKGTEIDEK